MVLHRGKGPSMLWLRGNRISILLEEYIMMPKLPIIFISTILQKRSGQGLNLRVLRTYQELILLDVLFCRKRVNKPYTSLVDITSKKHKCQTQYSNISPARTNLQSSVRTTQPTKQVTHIISSSNAPPQRPGHDKRPQEPVHIRRQKLRLAF